MNIVRFTFLLATLGTAATASGQDAKSGLEQAFADIERQVAFGPRVPGTAPHRAMAAQRGVATDGVYVAYFSYGSPATRYGLWAGRRVVEVNEQAIPDLDAFIDVVKDLEHSESVRIKTMTWNGKAEVITLKLDNHYWPAWEVRREDGRWRRTDFGT